MLSLANTYPEKAQAASSLIRNMTEALRTVLNSARTGESTDAAWNLFYQFKNEFRPWLSRDSMDGDLHQETS